MGLVEESVWIGSVEGGRHCEAIVVDNLGRGGAVDKLAFGMELVEALECESREVIWYVAGTRFVFAFHLRSDDVSFSPGIASH